MLIDAAAVVAETVYALVAMCTFTNAMTASTGRQILPLANKS